jgi:1-aminocyclopropane-1-carboxylate deaminase/D-cysteine desulfhydrase-like pyridoxal-dependent ACC family enzyme
MKNLLGEEWPPLIGATATSLSGDIQVIISAKAARLPFEGCSADYIRNVCHGRCCWTTGENGKLTTTIFVEPDQLIQITQRGGVVQNGIIQTASSGKCRFQATEGFCSLHNERSPEGKFVKPRSCYISPWILTANNKLIIRNRYKMLRCFKAEPQLPAYRAFFSGLVMLFGVEQAQIIANHFDTGGDDYSTILSCKRAALVRHVMSVWHEDYYGEAPTPVERHGDIWIKRDDLACKGLGAKARAIAKLLTQHKPTQMVTCGSRHSVQVVVAAKLCKQSGVALTIHTSAGEETDEMKQAQRLGAKIILHRPGYMSVVRKRAQDAALKSKALLLPFGMLYQDAIDLIIKESAALSQFPFKRIVVCGGAGVTAAGILLGTKKIPVIVVEVGGSTEKTISKFAQKEMNRVTIIPPTTGYSTPAVQCNYNGVLLDPFYEAKCLPYLRKDDLFWLTAHRNALYA